MNIQELAQKLKNNIKTVIIGKDEVVEKVVAALICGGHVLLEDIPGTGKTTLAKALARSVDCSFGRVQFTPDLLPSDLTGINYFNQKEGDFVFRAGTVFTNILLADEINRATPRTQSSLLECMEERQVTVEGVTYGMREPFMVIATQNPIEIQGTFPLPEAQLDRFFMRLSMGYPSRENELTVMESSLSGVTALNINPVASGEDIMSAREQLKDISAGSAVREYILDIVTATRESDKLRLGSSTRGALALLRASQGCAALDGRDYVLPDDVKAMAVCTLAHRVIAKGGSLTAKSTAAEEIIELLLNSVTVPTEDSN